MFEVRKPDVIRKTTEGCMGFCQEATKVRIFKNGGKKVEVREVDTFNEGGVCRMGGERVVLGCTNHAFRDEVRTRLEGHELVVDKIMRRYRAPISLCLGNYKKGEVMVGICPFVARMTIPDKKLEAVAPAIKRKRGRPRKG